MKKLLILLAAAVFLAACSKSERTDEAPSARSFAPGEKIELKGAFERTFVLQRTENGWQDANHPENVLLIDVFGTFCPPCQKEAPQLYDISLLPGVSVIALSYAERASLAKLQDFAQKYNAYYFLSGDENNESIVEQIAADVGFLQQVQLPFKVLLSGGKYQNIGEQKWLLGTPKSQLLRKSIDALARQSVGE